MNYYNLNKIFKSVSLNHNLVAEYSEGDIYEVLNEGQHKYPSIILTTQTINNNGITDMQTIKGTLFYVDRLIEDLSNKIMIQSNAMTILKLIFVKLLEDHSDITIESENYVPFLEKFADMCAGMYCTFSLSYLNDIICSDSEYEIKTITLTSNGIYDVIGYDTAIVNVVPVWGTIIGNVTAQTDLVEYIDAHSANIEAGENINITTSGNTKVISATDTIYDDSELRGLISGNTQSITNEVSARTAADTTLQAQVTANTAAIATKQDALTAGDNINITGNTISAVNVITKYGEQTIEGTKIFGQETASSPDANLIVRWYKDSRAGTSVSNYGWQISPESIYYKEWGGRTPAAGTELGRIAYKTDNIIDYGYPGTFALSKSISIPGIYSYRNTDRSNTKTFTTNGSIVEFQPKLTSGTNIKTINNKSLLGSGNIEIQSGTEYTGGTGISVSGSTISAVKGEWEWKGDGTNSISLGNNANATATDSIAIGNEANANRNNQIVIGKNKPLIIYSGAENIHHPTVVIGANKTTGGNNKLIFDGVMVGQDNEVWLSNGQIQYAGKIPAEAIIIGNKNTVKETYTEGIYNDTAGKDNIVIGNNNINYASGSTICGNYCVNGYSGSTTHYTKDNIIIGNNASGGTQDCITIGNYTRTYQPNSIAIGKDATVIYGNATQIGSGSNSNPGTLQFRQYPLVASDGKIYDDRLKLKTINNQSIKGTGNITIDGGSGKVKKVSVHKAIPCAKRNPQRTTFIENFGGRDGNLYFKQRCAYWIFRKVTREQFEMMDDYDGEYFDILSYHQFDNYYNVYISFDNYLEDTDKGFSSNAYIFKADTNYSLHEFLTNSTIRNSMLTDVTESSDIPCKSDFRIERGRVICIKEPDLEIGISNTNIDVDLVNYGFYAKNKHLFIKNGLHYESDGSNISKNFTLDFTYNSYGDTTYYKQNYHAVLVKGWIMGGREHKQTKKPISTNSIERLQQGCKVRIYPNARKRYRSIRYFDFMCKEGKFLRRLI